MHELRVGPKGRIVIPASLRRELEVAHGDVLVGQVDDGQKT